MSSKSPKRELFGHFAAIAKALGHEHRLELLEHLGQGERSVETLADRTGISIANTSQHLQYLRRAGLLDSRREGKHVLYRLADDAVVTLISALQRLAERNLAEVEKVVAAYFHARDNLEPVSRQELLQRMRKRLITVLDVRPEDEFALGHLPGALNIPVSELEQRLGELRKSHEIVAYCRGAYCVLSYQAVEALRRRGFKVRRLEEGYPEWRAAGLPVEQPTAAD
jgi:rhodanese-related sulfurtransferase/DNA-binding HxlR family transcriptional regulator